MTSDTEKRKYLLRRVAGSVREIEACAQIYLYGSRARGDFDEESDWDFLIILDGVVDTCRQEAIWRRLYDLRLDLDEVVSAVIVSADQWVETPCPGIPLFDEVRREGVAV